MRSAPTRYACLSLAVLGIAGGTALAQIVRIAPVVKQTATPDTGQRLPGSTPPASDTTIAPGSTFFIEFWATNAGDPLDGLACVHVDLSYNDPALAEAVPPAQAGTFFPVQAVTPDFDGPSGTVGDLGGCQTAPPVDGLGVGEWVLVERVEMSASAAAGRVTVSLTDANNLFAGTTLIGGFENLDPGDIDFLEGAFCVGACQSADLPASSTWATLIVCLLLLATATLTLRRRRVVRT